MSVGDRLTVGGKVAVIPQQPNLPASHFSLDMY